MNSAESVSPIGFRAFSAMAIVWIAGAYFAGQQVASLPFGFVVISVFIFAVPIALSGAYSSAVNQARAMSYYATSGWVYKTLSGRLIRSIFWVLWALTSSFVMLLQFSRYSGLEWLTLCLVIPAFWLVHSKSRQLLSHELRKRYVITSFTIIWTRRLCPVLMLVVYAVLIWSFTEIQSYASLSEALAAKKVGIPNNVGSTVVQAALLLITFMDGTKAYLVGHLKQFNEHLPLLLTIVSGYIVFFNACATFACFVMPPHEYRRIFGPISDDDVPPPLTKSRIAVASAVITFVALFVYLPLFAQLETGIHHHPIVIETIKKFELNVEKIDEAFYNPGTIQKIELAKAIALGKVNVSRATLEGQVDRAFDRMEQNVDSYLDWYYSLSGEYVRLAKLMTGEIEGYMETKLSEKLQQGEAFKDVSDSIKTALARYKNVTDEYRQTANEILDTNRLAVPASGATIVKKVSLNDILAFPTHLDVVAFNNRVAGGAVAAGVSAAVTAKIVGKGAFKAAAKALSKAAISKAAGVVGGAGIGAAIGSVIPFFGTVIGGVIGGAVGGVIVDGALLKLEEAISRSEFKKEIIAAIQEVRVTFKSKVLGTQ